MNALVTGSNGFIGRAAALMLEERGYTVYRAARSQAQKTIPVDFCSRSDVFASLRGVSPKLVVQCAGVTSGDLVGNNRIMTDNILDWAIEKNVDRFIVLGSAAEYGHIKQPGAVSEDTPLLPFSDYGRSKKDEVLSALDKARHSSTRVVVARLFNVVGRGMGEKMLLPSLLRQANAYKQGSSETMRVNRFDTSRDYIDIRDVVSAFMYLAEEDIMFDVYNVGSGRSVSTLQLIDLLLSELGLHTPPRLEQVDDEPELRVADSAGVKRLRGLGWQPKYELNASLKEIINGQQY